MASVAALHVTEDFNVIQTHGCPCLATQLPTPILIFGQETSVIFKPESKGFPCIESPVSTKVFIPPSLGPVT